METSGTDGVRKQSRKRFRTLAAAVKFHSGVVSDRGRGVHIAPSELTVQKAVEDWLAGQRIRPKTMSAYVTALRPVVDHLGDRTVQSITKADIEAVRGVAVDGVLQKIIERGLVKIGGRADLPGRPLLYETTDLFLEHFGVRSIDELPNASELRTVPLPTAKGGSSDDVEETPKEEQLRLADAKGRMLGEDGAETEPSEEAENSEEIEEENEEVETLDDAESAEDFSDEGLGEEAVVDIEESADDLEEEEPVDDEDDVEERLENEEEENSTP